MLTLTNTQTRTKEYFEPQGDTVTLYVCGVTPYDYSHIGHARCYVTFDLLVRVLKMLGHRVTYVRNFTDIDDKLLKRAEKEHGNVMAYPKLSETFMASFHEDMKALNCLVPDAEPTVTGHMPAIISFISELIDAGKAYVVGHDVYFSVPSFEQYGALSGRKLDEMVMGSRVEVSKKKRNPADFALWKGNDEGQFWDAPWGHGRPGWHIECSALARKYLGETIDIHGGGMDLIFPHHENELAQSESLHNLPFARYWVHNALVTLGDEKMSKSLGNIFLIREVLKQYDPMVLRYYLLQHYYRGPLSFSLVHLDGAQRAYERIVDAVGSADAASVSITQEKGSSELWASLRGALCDDMNTPKFLALIFENFAQIKESPAVAAEVKALFTQVLGLTCAPLTEEVVTPEIEALLAEREEARVAKDWARADAIRDKLKALGYKAQDKKLD